jgi:hypothetical protein
LIRIGSINLVPATGVDTNIIDADIIAGIQNKICTSDPVCVLAIATRASSF